MDCVGCNSAFSISKIPKKLRNCDHSVCEKCLISLIVCPSDSAKIELRKYTMKGFQTNHHILSQLQNSCEMISSKCIPKPLQQQTPCLKNTAKDNQVNSFKSILSEKSGNDNRQSEGLMKSKVVIKEAVVEQTKQQHQKHNEDHKEMETCLLHAKIADVLCLDCNEQICSSCALFGGHRGHKVDNFDSFILKLTGLTDNSLTLLQEIKEKEECLNIQVVNQYINDSFAEEKNTIIKNIKQFTTKIIQRVRKAEKAALSELDKCINQKKTALVQKIQLKQLEEKTKQFYQQVEKLGDVMKSVCNYKSINLGLKYFDEKCQESYVAKNGEYLKIQYATLETMFKGIIDNEVKTISPFINHDLLDIIEQCYNLNHQQTSLKLSPNHNNIKSHAKISTPHINIKTQDKPTVEDEEDILLDLMGEFQQSNPNNQVQSFQSIEIQSNCVANSVANSVAKSLQINKFISSSSIKRPSISKITDHNSYLPVTIENNTEKYTINSQAEIKKRRKTVDIQVPPKFKDVLEDLKNDRCQVIDFGGAQLGDIVLISLCQTISKTRKLRNIKLIKNKLTDNSMEYLFNACIGTNVTSINLAYNLLTEKTLQLIENSNLGQVKNITLNYNKINKKNVKSKLDVLLKKNAIVSL